MEHKYIMNGDPVTEGQIILEARIIDDTFGVDGFCYPTEAAVVLRRNGYIVNPINRRGEDSTKEVL